MMIASSDNNAACIRRSSTVFVYRKSENQVFYWAIVYLAKGDDSVNSPPFDVK